jgi:uncharacterized protein (TIGR02246 family)
MNVRQIALVTLATGLLVAGCAKKEETPTAEEQAAAAAPAVDLAAEEQAIRTRSGEWMNYVNSKDSTSIANNIFAPDAVMISDDKAHKGTAAIQAAMDAQIKEMPDALVSWSSDQVRVAESGDLAVETGSFTVDPDGDGKKPAVQGSFATTWVKVDGQWRALTDAGGENAAAATP